MMAPGEDDHNPAVPMSPLGGDYSSFLLRIWRLREDGATRWRLVLVSTTSGQEWHFASLEALVGFVSNPPRPTPAEPSGETSEGTHH